MIFVSFFVVSPLLIFSGRWLFLTTLYYVLDFLSLKDV